MGKHTSTNQKNICEAHDSEMKVLIDKCNVCHSNLNSVEHGKYCNHHHHSLHGKNFHFSRFTNLLPRILID